LDDESGFERIAAVIGNRKRLLAGVWLPAAAALATIGIWSPAFAWDGAVTGKITQLDVAEGGNYDFRVTLEGYPALCANGPNWAYLNASHSNYQAYVSAMLLAYANGATVTIYTNRDAAGYCRIGYFVLRPRS
jgi:hypothetical protein